MRMIVVDVFFNGTAKRAFPKEDHLAQAFGFDAAEKAFDERNGGMEEWRNGGMEEWRNGGMEEWRNGDRLAARLERCLDFTPPRFQVLF